MNMRIADVVRDIARETEHVRRRIRRLDLLAAGGRVNEAEFPAGRAWMAGMEIGLGAANLMLLKRYARSAEFDSEFDEARLLWEMFDSDDPRLSGEDRS